MTRLAELRELLAKATPGPWDEDDGNIFSRPLSNERHAIIMRRIQGEDIPHPDGDEPMGYVASTGQVQPNFENDAALIPAAVNALPALLDVAAAAEKLVDAYQRALEAKAPFTSAALIAHDLRSALAKLGDNK